MTSRLKSAPCVFALLACVALTSACSSMGAHPEGEQLARLRGSPEWHDGRFRNTDAAWTDIPGALMDIFSGSAGVEADTPVPVVESDGSQYELPPASGLRVTWFGRSSTMIEIDGVKRADRPNLE